MPSIFDSTFAKLTGYLQAMGSRGQGILSQMGQQAQAKSLYMDPNQKSVSGLVAPGNIDLAKLPMIYNPDGSWSTLYSTSFTDERAGSPTHGKEVLVRGILNNQRTDDVNALREQYYRTGQHLGVFDNPNAADRYGQTLHENWENGRIPGVVMFGKSPVTAIGGEAPPNAPPPLPRGLR